MLLYTSRSIYLKVIIFTNKILTNQEYLSILEFEKGNSAFKGKKTCDLMTRHYVNYNVMTK